MWNFRLELEYSVSMVSGIRQSDLALHKMLRGSTALFCCDIQERFRPLIHDFPALIHSAKKMLRGSEVFGLPLVVTEQYPKAMGKTVPELWDDIIAKQSRPPAVFDSKTQFSMVTPAVKEYLKSQPSLKAVALMGIESHVCVLQTALQLRQMNYDIYLIADAISSSDRREIPLALKAMRQAGCVITSSDSFLFRVCHDASDPQFKQISKLVKESLESPMHNSLL